MTEGIAQPEAPVVAVPKLKLKKVVFDPQVFGQAMANFAKALPNESICLLSGRVDEQGILRATKYWDSELEESTPVSAKLSSKYLLKFPKMLTEQNPDHNGVIEAHRHPIGDSMSGTDRDSLFLLSTWSDEIYWCMIACDIPLGVYTVRNEQMIRLPWEVKNGAWKESKEELEIAKREGAKPTGLMTRFATLGSFLRKIMKRLQ